MGLGLSFRRRVARSHLRPMPELPRLQDQLPDVSRRSQAKEEERQGGVPHRRDDGIGEHLHAGIALRQLGCFSEDRFSLSWVLDIHQARHAPQQPQCLLDFRLALAFRRLIDNQHRLV